eukprot:Platyproteum_vivax@DN6756_c0_g1_i4.p1
MSKRVAIETDDVEEPDLPNFEPSGLLAAESNSRNGVVLKYYEPPEARLPKDHWRLYMYKGDNEEETRILHIHRKNSWLFGKDSRIADITTQHPTCSKQHAVIQFRHKPQVDDIVPYVMDLESTNGTLVNKSKIDSACYFELKHLDILTFGRSSREYVLLCAEKEHSKK